MGNGWKCGMRIGMINNLSEIKFKRDTTFRHSLFTPESFSHPAKMDSQLLIWIVEKFTSEGETILDPMFGSGTTMLACTIGRNVIGVELEDKFVKMAAANWQKVSTMPQLGYSMGNCQILHGDARNLEGSLVDKIISSPPYASGGHHPDQTGSWGGQSQALTKEQANYGMSQGQIGRLDYGNIDKIVTSPPYEASITGEPGIDWTKCDGGKRDRTKEAGFKGVVARHSGSSVDSIVTSPPYEGIEARDRSTDESYRKDRETTHAGGSVKLEHGYQGTAANIGNLKSDNYLSAMLLVYQQCFKVLKDNGLMILVTKNFIRNQKEVRLDLDTIKLCESAGFTFQERHYRKLAGQSFWRVIYNQKYPDAPVLDKEDILVFKKQSLV